MVKWWDGRMITLNLNMLSSYHPIILFSRSIKSAYTECQSAEINLTETCFANNFLHHFALRESTDALGQGGVSTIVF